MLLPGNPGLPNLPSEQGSASLPITVCREAPVAEGGLFCSPCSRLLPIVEHSAAGLAKQAITLVRKHAWFAQADLVLSVVCHHLQRCLEACYPFRDESSSKGLKRPTSWRMNVSMEAHMNVPFR